MTDENEPQAIPVLVVEDDTRLAQGLCRNLELEGFAPTSVATR